MLCKNHRNIRFMGSISCIGRILVLEGYLCSSVINIYKIYWTDFAKNIYWRNEDKIYKLIYKKKNAWWGTSVVKYSNFKLCKGKYMFI